MISPPPDDETIKLLVEAAIWGLSREAGLGAAVAEGVLRLMEKVSFDRLSTYVALVREAAETGETRGRILATFLAPVLMQDDDFLQRFQNTVQIMLNKGNYTLNAPLEAMEELLAEDDAEAASCYLDLLAATFEQNISYNQSLRLVYLLPKAVTGFTSGRRRFQIAQLHRVVQFDLKLIDPFLDGLEKGSGLLDGQALEHFVNQGLKLYKLSPSSSVKFLRLSSKVGQDAAAALQRAVPLSQIRGQLNRYLQARLGRSVAVKPLSALPEDKADVEWVCSDGRYIYLPDEIDHYESQADNIQLFKSLLKLEAGFFECRTHDFDVERASCRYPELAPVFGALTVDRPQGSICDGERFLSRFHPAALAADLFDLFEQARVTAFLEGRYPGLMRRVMPLLCRQAERAEVNGILADDHLLAPLYAKLVLGRGIAFSTEAETAAVQRALGVLFEKGASEGDPVEASARRVCIAFECLKKGMGKRLAAYRPLVFPFGRRIHWELASRAFAAEERAARRIKMRLSEQGLEVYRSDLRKRLAERQGNLTPDDIVELVLIREGGQISADAMVDLTALDLDDLLQRSGIDTDASKKAGKNGFSYPEWDHHLQDYLYDHTHVYEKDLPGGPQGEADFYDHTLLRHYGLVARMRRAFELLKPEGMALLRQWPEGDAFDYRALLDYAMDRRAGRIPSDRLFIKRLKQERDVSVMLLVDLSRSTSNTVPGGNTSVLDVAKEAVVLFCEALQVVGDDYAIAGFSGTGRHSVDFYSIKRFEEPFGDAVKSRISYLQPQRSTRMGAAIRHAGATLAQTDSRVKLMIVVSDGFPNDLGYKSDYAIADTRRSVQEARSRSLHVKAITVNIGSDPLLDDLYGRVNHHVIGDVRELPDKLLRLYGTLTRF